MKHLETYIEYIFILLLFVAGVNLFVYLKTSGLDNVLAISEKVNTNYTLKDIYLEASMLGLILGIQIIGLQNHIMVEVEKKISRPYTKVLWLISILYLIVINTIGIRFLYANLWLNIPAEVAWENSLLFVSTSLFLSFLVFFFIVGFFVRFLRQLRLNFGEAVFYNFLLGKYFKPEEEERLQLLWEKEIKDSLIMGMF